jgi:hypothetical protein
MWVASGVSITRMMSSSTREELTVRSDEPIVQPLPIVTEGAVELVVGAGDVPSSDIDI